MTWGFETTCVLVVVATPATLQPSESSTANDNHLAFNMGLITVLCSFLYGGQLVVKGWVGWTRVLSELDIQELAEVQCYHTCHLMTLTPDVRSLNLIRNRSVICIHFAMQVTSLDVCDYITPIRLVLN